MIKILLNLDNYAFTFIAAASMLVGILVELFGFYVLVRERVSRTGMLFCLFATCMSIWLTCFGFLYASVQPVVAMWWLKCSYTGVTFIPATGLLLAYAVIPQKDATHLRKLIPVCIVLSALFLVATVFTDTLIKGLYQYSWGYYPRFAPAGILFLLYFALTSIYVLRIFWIGYQSSAGTKTRKRFIGLLLGFSIGYLASADFIGDFGIPFYPVGYIVIIPSLVIIAYIVSRYRLIDITPEL